MHSFVFYCAIPKEGTSEEFNSLPRSQLYKEREFPFLEENYMAEDPLSTAHKNWCFTLFTNEEPTWDPATMQLLVYQLELCPTTNNRHWQGTVEFIGRHLRDPARRLLYPTDPSLRFYCAPRKKSRGAAVGYACLRTKLGVVLEEEPRYYPNEYTCKGDSDQGKRNDIHDFRDAARERNLNRHDMLENYPLMLAKYPRFVTTTINHYRERRLPILGFTPRKTWQSDLISLVGSVSDNRSVHWYWSHSGGVGKSTLASYLVERCNAHCVDGGKFGDIYYSYLQSDFPPVFIVDWPRNKEIATFPYTVLESLKNGRFLNTKYEAQMCRFNPPHVIIFANEKPDMAALSADRWNIVFIEN